MLAYLTGVLLVLAYLTGYRSTPKSDHSCRSKLTSMHLYEFHLWIFFFYKRFMLHNMHGCIK